MGFALAILATGCSSDDFGGSASEGTGGLDLQVAIDTEVIASQRPTKAPSRAEFDQITADDLSLRLTSDDGSFTKTWDKIADFDANERFNVGRYTLEAFYGSEDAEGFDAPYYLGSQTITVEENQVTPVAISAQLANSLLAITYTDNFKSYMASYSAEVHSAGGATTAYAADETRPVYVKAGLVEVYVDFVKPNGKGAKLLAASFTAKPRCRYNLTVDMSAEGGQAILHIVYDEMLAEEDVEIELSDELLNSPAPEVTANGFTSGEAIRFVPGNAPTDPMSLDIVARGGLARVTMTTRSASLLAQGWPAEVNLAGAPEATRTRLAALGLTARGLYTNPEKMAVVTLTDVPSHIALVDGDDGVTEISFVVVDAMGKASDPVTLRIEAAALAVSLDNPANLFVGQTELELDMSYNGGKPEGAVKIQYFNDRGTWTDAAYTASATGTDDLYHITLTGLPATGHPESTSALRLRAVAGSLISEELSVDRMPTDVRLTATEGAAFARHAYISASLQSAGRAALNLDPVLAAGRLMLSTDGGSSWTAATATIADGTFTVTGLTPATAYSARFELAGCDPSPAVTFTTEATPQLPNAGMESWYSTDAYTHKSLWVGETDIKCWYPNESGQSFWATRNPRTTGQTSGTTCHYTSYSGTLSVAGRNGNAAEISTLGYGEGTTYTHTGSGSTGDPKKKIGGLLFTGTYSCSGDNETRNLGQPFTARPAALSFYYKFSSVASESFRVTIILENRSGDTTTQLGKGEFTSSESHDSFTKCDIPVTYTNKALKATHITVMFESTTSDSPTVLSKQGSKGAINGYGDSRYVGNVLTVDDIELIY